jgi:hypothetical protein
MPPSEGTLIGIGQEKRNARSSSGELELDFDTVSPHRPGASDRQGRELAAERDEGSTSRSPVQKQYPDLRWE